MIPNNTLEVRKAEVKAKLITRTYTLQCDRAKYTNGKENNICKLCNKEPEDTEHFLFHCEKLLYERQKHLNTLSAYLDQHAGSQCYVNIVKNGLLLKLILDPSSPELRQLIRNRNHECNINELEGITRTFCYGLHTKRASILISEN